MNAYFWKLDDKRTLCRFGFRTGIATCGPNTPYNSMIGRFVALFRALIIPFPTPWPDRQPDCVFTLTAGLIYDIVALSQKIGRQHADCLSDKRDGVGIGKAMYDLAKEYV
jgi:hypothetical protein